MKIKKSKVIASLISLILVGYITTNIGIKMSATIYSSNETIDIPDPILRNKLESLTGKAGQSIEISDLEALEGTITIDGGVEDLTGMEYLTNITDLELEKNKIIDLTPINKLEKLEILNVNNNEIIELPNMEKMTNLKELDISDNKLTSLNGIKTESALNVVNFENNNINDLTGIENSVNLTTINLKNNNITDISKFTTLENITNINLDDNQISDLSPIVNSASISAKNQIVSYGQESGYSIGDTYELKKAIDVNNNPIDFSADSKLVSGVLVDEINHFDGKFNDTSSNFDGSIHCDIIVGDKLAINAKTNVNVGVNDPIPNASDFIINVTKNGNSYTNYKATIKAESDISTSKVSNIFIELIITDNETLMESIAYSMLNVEDLNAPIIDTNNLIINKNDSIPTKKQFINSIIDPEDGDLKIDDATMDSSTVDITTSGKYTIVFTILDTAGNKGVSEATLTINPGSTPIIDAHDVTRMIESEKPIITDYVDGVSDDDDTDLTIDDIEMDDSAVNMDKDGIYPVYFSVEDKVGSIEKMSVNLTVEKDTIAPTMDYNDSIGRAPNDDIPTVSDFVNSVSDNVDTDLTIADVTMKSNKEIDMAKEDDYEITLTLTDKYGNDDIEHSKLTVTSAIIPTISADDIQVPKNSKLPTKEAFNLNVHSYDPEEIITVDDIEMDLSDVNMSVPADYYAHFSVMDSAGEVGHKDAKVTVVDKTGPKLELQAISRVKGNEKPVIGNYVIKVIDHGDESFSIEDLTLHDETVDMNELGNYSVIIDGTDANGFYVSETTNLIILENEGPVISTNELTRSSNTSKPLKEEYIDGLFDTKAGNIFTMDDVEMDDSAVDMSKLGTYDVILKGTDDENITTSVTTSLTIIDETAPVITTQNVVIDIGEVKPEKKII